MVICNSTTSENVLDNFFFLQMKNPKIYCNFFSLTDEKMINAIVMRLLSIFQDHYHAEITILQMWTS